MKYHKRKGLSSRRANKRHGLQNPIIRNPSLSYWDFCLSKLFSFQSFLLELCRCLSDPQSSQHLVRCTQTPLMPTKRSSHQAFVSPALMRWQMSQSIQVCQSPSASLLPQEVGLRLSRAYIPFLSNMKGFFRHPGKVFRTRLAKGVSWG